MDEVASAPLAGGTPLRFAVHRIPFMLEPGYDEDERFDESHRDRMLRKFGSQEGWDRVRQSHRLAERGQEVGIAAFNEQRVVSNTVRSHRLVQWVARVHGLDKSEALYTVLNRRHFIEGAKLNDAAMLAAAAGEAGVDEQAAFAFLGTHEGRDDILDTVAKVHAAGIHSIPTFIIDGRTVLQGAQPASEFVAVFRDIERQPRPAGARPGAGPVFAHTAGATPAADL